MKYYVVAGEASGDLHAANLIKALKREDPEAEFFGWGGDLMRAEGLHLLRHYRDTAFMGFAELLLHLRSIAKNLSACKRDLKAYRPDAVLLIDYPTFNLRIAAFARRWNFRVYYYISPKVWAWKASRVHAIRRSVNRLFVILPFEAEFYARYAYAVDFVGHPLLDAIAHQQLPSREAFSARNGLSDKPIVALLPGSRKQEIQSTLSLMLRAVRDWGDYQFVLAAAPGQALEFYKPLLRSSVALVQDQTYELLHLSQAALVTSGTATLEAALLGVPQVVCYRGSPISYAIGKRLVQVKYISLVNLILDRPVVTELIQKALNVENLSAELRKILSPSGRAQLLAAYAELKQKLGGPGASTRTARSIIADLKGAGQSMGRSAP